MRILVGGPVHSSKAYSVGEWIGALNALTYADKELCAVDNSQGTKFYQDWQGRIPMIRLDPGDEGTMHANRRIALSMEVLREKFVRGDFAYWLNVECDTIPPANTIEVMLDLIGDADFFCAPYPVRDRQVDMNTNSFGCTMFSRKLMSEMSFAGAPENPTTDRWIHNEVIAPAKGRYKVVNMPTGILEVRHLQNPDSWGWAWW